MTEKQMQTLFRKYLEKNPPSETCVYELKIARGKSLAFEAVKEHQIEALRLASSGRGFFHKITDPPVFTGMNSRFNLKRPFDCFYVKGVKTYVVIWFFIPRTKKVFWLIEIETFLRMKNSAVKKSFREELLYDMEKAGDSTISRINI